MKLIISIALVLSFTELFSTDLFAQVTPAHNDSIAAVLKLNGLQAKRDKLEMEIKVQDRKRNSQIVGVSPETLEMMNNRQDSICLALRSQLVDVILEIKEITPEVTSSQLLQQYNNLLNRKEETPAKEDNKSMPAAISVTNKYYRL